MGTTKKNAFQQTLMRLFAASNLFLASVKAGCPETHPYSYDYSYDGDKCCVYKMKEDEYYCGDDNNFYVGVDCPISPEERGCEDHPSVSQDIDPAKDREIPCASASELRIYNKRAMAGYNDWFKKISFTDSAEKCFNHCLDEPRCVAFTYSKTGKICYLQETATSLGKSSSKWISGVRCDELSPYDQPNQTYQKSAASNKMKLYDADPCVDAGCSHGCSNVGGKAVCNCDGTKLVFDPNGDTKTCVYAQCAWNMHGCDNDAICIDIDLDNLPTDKASAEQVSTTCECNSPKTVDGYQCTYCPSHDECWTYNATTHVCSMEPSCSTLTCGALNIDIEMEPELFGLNDPESAVWASIAQPTYSGNKLRCGKELGNADQRVYMIENEDKLVAEVTLSIGGNDRQRSAVRGTELNLGDMAVYTSNVGIQVLYRCEYPTNVDVSSQPFDVQTISAFGQNAGVGNLAGGFSMELSSPTEDGSRFIMGGQLEVAVNWGARFLSQFSFRISECSVLHGDTHVDVIKGGCYSGLLEAQPVEVDSNLSQQFIFNMFKALDEESQTQVISCEVKVCKDYCSQSGEDARPVDDVMNFQLP